MSNKQATHASPGGQQPRDVKPGDAQDRQRERQDSHPESAEQPGSAGDIAKEHRRG